MLLAARERCCPERFLDLTPPLPGTTMNITRSIATLRRKCYLHLRRGCPNDASVKPGTRYAVSQSPPQKKRDFSRCVFFLLTVRCLVRFNRTAPHRMILPRTTPHRTAPWDSKKNDPHRAAPHRGNIETKKTAPHRTAPYTMVAILRTGVSYGAD